jgi:PLP dependent protein
MINIEEYYRLKSELDEKGVKLIAVSKTQPIEKILELYHIGHRAFGENRPLELRDKQSLLPVDIEWHFIGHLQTNKIKYIIPFVHLIHSVDSFRLLIEINKEAEKKNRVVDCLLQVYIAQEDTKFGFDNEELVQALASEEFRSLKNIRIRGLMGMATFTDDIEQVSMEFRHLEKIFKEIKASTWIDTEFFTELSMGMTDDYKIAVEEGSTMLRIGTLIFGSRY